MPEFKLKKDWDFDRMIYKGDDWVHQQAYDNAYGSVLEYLGVESDEELTVALLDEAELLIKYLETPRADGGLEVNDSSPTYYGYYAVVRDLRDNFDENIMAALS
jgi:hypothetical protein